jgi:hypothetical protein
VASTQVGKQIESRVTTEIWDAITGQVMSKNWTRVWKEFGRLEGEIRHNVWCRAAEKHRGKWVR